MDAVQHLIRRLGAGVVLATALAATSPAVAQATSVNTGYMVLDLNSGTVLEAAQADKSFIPASVAKLPTGLSILRTLGANHRFVTRLVADGPVDGAGVLHGNLYLVGGADPVLDGAGLDSLVRQMQAAGITGLTGGFYYDASALPALETIEPNQPPDASYNPGIVGLAVDFNRIILRWQNGTVIPSDLHMGSLPVFFQPETAQGEAWFPIREPGAYAAAVFRQTALRRGLMLPDPQEGHAPTLAVWTLASLDSPPASELVRRILFFSNNVATEMLALAATGQDSLAEATAALTRALQQEVSLDWTGYALPNASGLSAAARMTPRQCAEITRHALLAEVDGVAYRSLLPGIVTTPNFGMTDRSLNTTSPVRAKSGTVNYGRALAGVARTASGREVAFCVMSDDQAARAAYDAVPFPQRRGGAVRTQARTWLAAAREAEGALVLGWMSLY